MNYSNFEAKRNYKHDKPFVLRHLRMIVLSVVVTILVASPLAYLHTLNRDRDIRRHSEFLQDFEYLINALEENFPLFDIIAERHGTDMKMLGQELLDYIANEGDEMTYRAFSRLIRNNFFGRAGNAGNLGILGFHCKEIEVALLSRDWQGNTNRILRYTGLLKNARFHSALFEIPITREVSGEWWTPAWIQTEILEEERIAYISFSILPVFIDQREIGVIDAFYREIEHFEHLIIDLRDVEGRNSHFFHHVIAGPLIQGPPLEESFRHFYLDGEHNRMYFSDIPGLESSRTDTTVLALLNTKGNVFFDSGSMDYYFVETHTVFPRNPGINFNGRIWMLIDGNTRNGGQQIASIYKNTGFATLVGETTGGSFGYPLPWGPNYFVLPHTGFVIRYNPTLAVDSRGRPLELGTEPHYFNRPGLDALETVLYLINLLR